MATESKRMSARRETVEETREASHPAHAASGRAATPTRTAPAKSAPTRTGTGASAPAKSPKPAKPTNASVHGSLSVTPPAKAAPARSARRGAVVALRVVAAASERETAPHTEPRTTQPPRAEANPANHTSHTPTRDLTPPGRRANDAQRQFAELNEALETGWEIVQPVFARPLWSAADDSLTAYSFVLRQGTATRLITVPGSHSVERFISAQKLTVDERR